MAGEEADLHNLVLIRLQRLNTRVQGVVTGIIVGLAVFVATNWLLITAEEGQVVGPHLSLLSQFFFGYEVSFLGSLIGLAYGFLTGFLVGYSVSHMYNWIAGLRERKPNATTR